MVLIISTGHSNSASFASLPAAAALGNNNEHFLRVCNPGPCQHRYAVRPEYLRDHADAWHHEQDLFCPCAERKHFARLKPIAHVAASSAGIPVPESSSAFFMTPLRGPRLLRKVKLTPDEPSLSSTPVYPSPCPFTEGKGIFRVGNGLDCSTWQFSGQFFGIVTPLLLSFCRCRYCKREHEGGYPKNYRTLCPPLGYVKKTDLTPFSVFVYLGEY